MTARRVLLWRHGRTTWNVQRRFQGQADSPLDEVGRSQARIAASMIAEFRPAIVVSSDLTRAVDTARALADAAGLPIELDRRLRERSLGRWEGLTRGEVASLYPDEFAAWLAGREDCQVGGETRSAVADRAAAALADVTDRADLGGLGDESIVLVTHSATAIALTGRLLGLPMASWRAVGPLANCHWTELHRDEHGWRLRAHNLGPVGPVTPRPAAEDGHGRRAEPAETEPADAEALDAGPPTAAPAT